MDRYFPDALKTLAEADPEIYGLVKAEEKRQWRAARVPESSTADISRTSKA